MFSFFFWTCETARTEIFLGDLNKRLFITVLRLVITYGAETLRKVGDRKSPEESSE